jgi:hypothetical protein
VVLGRARERYPAARVRPRRGKVTFLADASAATRVSGGGIPGERKEVGSA